MPYGLTGFTNKHMSDGTVDDCWTFQHLDSCGSMSKETIFDYGIIPGNMCDILLFALYIVGMKLLTAVADHYIGGGSPPQTIKAKSDYGEVPGDMGTGALSFTVPNKQFDGDTWHHVLVSVDMTGGSASTGLAAGESGYGGYTDRVTATSLMYVAVDDVNYPTGGNAWPGTNTVATGGAINIANTSQAADYEQNDSGYGYTMTPQGPIPSYSLKDMTVPAAPVGIPATEKYADKIHGVQMAELLFFTGDNAVLDTSQEENRRHFITKPDNNGFQHPVNFAPLYVPMRKFAFGDPATWEPGADNPAWAPPLFDPSTWPTGVKGLGTAAIDFTKCQWNWQMGRNLGTLSGKVTRTGKIKGLIPPVDQEPMIQAGGA